MRKSIFATLAIILGVALCWAAPPVDKIPSLLTTPAEARITSVIVGGSPPSPPAGITRLGFAHEEETGFPYSMTVSIPASTNLLVLFDCGYGTSDNRMTAADLGGTQNFTMDYTAKNDDGYCSVGHLFNPNLSGTTINITKAGMEYNSVYYAVYYSGVSSVGDTDGGSNSITLTTTSGNIVILGGSSADNDPAWTNATVIDSHDTSGGIYTDIAQMTADGVSETISHDGNSSYAGIAGIVLVP